MCTWKSVQIDEYTLTAVSQNQCVLGSVYEYVNLAYRVRWINTVDEIREKELVREGLWMLRWSAGTRKAGGALAVATPLEQFCTRGQGIGGIGRQTEVYAGTK